MVLYKGYQIKPHKEYPGSLIIVTDGKGGKIPDVMSGMFTSILLCKEIIDLYLQNREAVDVKKVSKA
jgi:hypothetical protein